jgi:hypothetical protein
MPPPASPPPQAPQPAPASQVYSAPKLIPDSGAASLGYSIGIVIAVEAMSDARPASMTVALAPKASPSNPEPNKHKGGEGRRSHATPVIPPSALAPPDPSWANNWLLEETGLTKDWQTLKDVVSPLRRWSNAFPAPRATPGAATTPHPFHSCLFTASIF